MWRTSESRACRMEGDRGVKRFTFTWPQIWARWLGRRAVTMTAEVVRGVVQSNGTRQRFSWANGDQRQRRESNAGRGRIVDEDTVEKWKWASLISIRSGPLLLFRSSTFIWFYFCFCFPLSRALPRLSFAFLLFWLQKSFEYHFCFVLATFNFGTQRRNTREMATEREEPWAVRRHPPFQLSIKMCNKEPPVYVGRVYSSETHYRHIAVRPGFIPFLSLNLVLLFSTTLSADGTSSSNPTWRFLVWGILFIWLRFNCIHKSLNQWGLPVVFKHWRKPKVFGFIWDSFSCLSFGGFL